MRPQTAPASGKLVAQAIDIGTFIAELRKSYEYEITGVAGLFPLPKREKP